MWTDAIYTPGVGGQPEEPEWLKRVRAGLPATVGEPLAQVADQSGDKEATDPPSDRSAE